MAGAKKPPVLIGIALPRHAAAWLYGQTVHRIKEIDHVLEHADLSDAERRAVLFTRECHITFLDACDAVMDTGLLRAQHLGPHTRRH